MVDAAGLLGRPITADNAAMENEPIAVTPKRKRRWFQFSLRTLLIGVTLLAVACGFLGSRLERKASDRQTVEWVVKMGGKAYYDYQQSLDGNVIAWALYAEPTGPAWLRRLLGQNFVSEVDFAWFNGLDFTDAELARIKQLTELEFLSLGKTKVSDAGLAEIKGLAKLKFLGLEGVFKFIFGP